MSTSTTMTLDAVVLPSEQASLARVAHDPVRIRVRQSGQIRPLFCDVIDHDKVAVLLRLHPDLPSCCDVICTPVTDDLPGVLIHRPGSDTTTWIEFEDYGDCTSFAARVLSSSIEIVLRRGSSSADNPVIDQPEATLLSVGEARLREAAGFTAAARAVMRTLVDRLSASRNSARRASRAMSRAIESMEPDAITRFAGEAARQVRMQGEIVTQMGDLDRLLRAPLTEVKWHLPDQGATEQSACLKVLGITLAWQHAHGRAVSAQPHWLDLPALDLESDDDVRNAVLAHVREFLERLRHDGGNNSASARE